jgi:precorrin isomerase
MPCRDYYDDNPAAYYGPKLADKDKEITKLMKQISFAESALCASLDALIKTSGKDDPFFDINFKEAGITRTELEDWHSVHKALDAKHRAEEAEKNRKKAAALEKIRVAELRKSAALAKLTPEEIELLNLK